MRTSFFLGTGIASSSSRRTSGGPYRVQTTALNSESPQPTTRASLLDQTTSLQSVLAVTTDLVP